MGLRKFGPIPHGIWTHEPFLDLPVVGRAAYLCIIGVCCYRGQFHRSPRLLDRAIAWPDGHRALGTVLVNLEAAGVITSYKAADATGREIWVGEVVGYHGIDGIPDNRRFNQPKEPDFPQAKSSVSDDYSEAKDKGKGSVSTGVSAGGKHPLSTVEESREREETNARARESASLHVSEETELQQSQPWDEYGNPIPPTPESRHISESIPPHIREIREARRLREIL
jgi:hypothetical protein